MSTQTTTSSGIGFVGLLTVLFIGLKLTGHIAWSWWIVLTTPIWASVAVIVAILGALIAFAALMLVAAAVADFIGWLWQKSMGLWRGR